MKRKTWKWILGVAGSIIAILAALYYDALRRAEAALARNRVELAEKIVAFQAMNRSRTPAFDPPVEGNAWSFYGPAFVAISAIPKELADQIPEIEGSVDPTQYPPDDHLLENLFAEHAPEIDAIRKGARSRVVDLGLRIQDGLRMEMPHTNGTILATKFITGAISHARRMGREGEGLELAELGLAMAQDIGRQRVILYSMLENVCEGRVAYAVRDLLADHSLSATQLSEFASRLDRLDAHRPDLMETWTGEDLSYRYWLCTAPWGEVARETGVGARKGRFRLPWRCLFSQRITRAQAVRIFSEIFERVHALAAIPPWLRESGCRGIPKEAYDSDNPLVELLLPAYGAAFKRDALTRLQRVLMRLSVGVAWFEAEHSRYPQQLEDLLPRYISKIPPCPFTGLPLHTRDGKVWSVGINRIDDGGVMDANEPEDGGSGDIVWTIHRK